MEDWIKKAFDEAENNDRINGVPVDEFVEKLTAKFQDSLPIILAGYTHSMRDKSDAVEAILMLLTKPALLCLCESCYGAGYIDRIKETESAPNQNSNED